MGRSAAWLALAAAASVAGYLARGSSPARIETRETARVVPITVTGGGAGPSTEELRAMIREELSRTAPAVAVEEPVAPPPAAYEAAAAAERILDDAAAHGVWTDADRLAFRHQVVAAPPSDRIELVAALSRAINDGLRVETAGAPF